MNSKSIYLTLAIIVFADSAFSINEGLLNSFANQQSEITLLQIPMTNSIPSEPDTITWTPSVIGLMWYSLNPGSAIPSNYPNHLTGTVPGMIAFDPASLPIGYLFCMITSTDTEMVSVEFNIVRESPLAVTMIYPQSNVSASAGILTTTPTFSWQPNPGVPYYHLILSDSPFEIERDPATGSLTTTGANIIWQVIVSGTSIVYGTPDPGNFFTNINTPPLIGDLTGSNRPTYNWIVLNNYTNSPFTSSDVVGELMAFEVSVAPPFSPPVLLSPQDGAVLNSDNILFQWSSIPEASNYHFYLCKEEVSPDGLSIIYTPAWYVQSTVNATELPASALLTASNYRWKVIAEDAQGEGTMSMPSDFYYDINSDTLHIYTRSNGVAVGQVQVDFIPIEGPSLSYTLTDNGGYAEKVLPYGTYYLELSKPGFVNLTSPQFTVDDTITITQTYELEELDASASGTVTNSQGTPIANSEVIVTNTVTNEEHTASCNNNGNFNIELVPGNWSFVATKVGFTSSVPRIVALQSGDNLDLNQMGGPLVMTANQYALDGYVINTAGEPISLALVTCTNGIDNYQLTTNNNGYYQLNVASGWWTLSAEKPAFWLSTTLPPIQVINSGSSNDITLVPVANIISGQVFEGVVLSPGNAVVRAIPTSGSIQEAQVNDQGSYLLSLSTGTYQLTAILEGFFSPTPLTLSLNVGETISGVNLSLIPNDATIQGKVTYDGVQGLAGVSVTAEDVTTVTNAQGNYTLNVPAGSHIVTASLTGYTTASTSPLNISSGQTLNNVNLTAFPNAVTINGVVSSNGQPVYQAEVTAHRDSVNGPVTTTHTAENGSYALGLIGGNYWLIVSKTGFASSSPMNLQANGGQTVNNVNFTLFPSVATILGSAVSAGLSLPYAIINVEALDNPSLIFNCQSGFSGSFNVSVSPNHSYIITVSKEGYISAVDTSNLLAPNSTQNFIFNLTECQSVLKGKVYGLPDSIALANVTMTAVSQSGQTFTEQTNSVGSYTLNINAGTYEITASIPGYVQSSRDTAIAAGQTIENFKFYLPPNFSVLQGFVKRLSNQQPIANAIVTVFEVNTQIGATVYTDNTGFYLFNQLFQGTYNITVSHPQYQSMVLIGLNILGGATANQNFTLSINDGSLAGTVLDNLNQPVNGATVSAYSASGSVYSDITDQNGAFELPYLPYGIYSASAVKEGYASTVEVDSLQLSSTNPSVSDISLQLARNDGVITGRVIDNFASGMGGVIVSASDNIGNYGSAVTSASGYYTIDDLYPQSIYSVNATINSYSNTAGPAQVDLNLANPGSANFTLYPNNLSLSGTIRNQVGTALANIPVQAVVGTVILSATTNSNGQYTINNVAPSTTYRVQTNTYNSQLIYAYIDTTTASVNLPGIDLVMQERSASISGLVKDSTGQVMINTEVKALASDGTVYTTFSSLNGSFTIPNLPNGNYQVYPSALGFVSAPPNQNVSLAVGQAVNLSDFVLSPVKIQISGTVRNFYGVPVPNIPVSIWSAQYSAMDTTDSNGLFSFGNLTSNVAYHLSTVLNTLEYTNGMRDIQAGYESLTGQDLGIIIRNALIRGKFRSETGIALTGVTVDGSAAAPIIFEQTITSTADSFVFSYLRGGTYTLFFHLAGYQDTDTVLVLAISDTVDLGEIVLPNATGIFGVITDGLTGLPLRNVIASVYHPSVGFVASDTSTVAGAYQINNITIGQPYTLGLVKYGFPETISDTINYSGANERNFTLWAYPNSIYGAVRDQFAVGQSGARVFAKKFDGTVFVDTANYFGDYSFSPMASGSYQLHAEADTLDTYYENTSLTTGGRSKKVLTALNTAKIYATATYNGQTPPGAVTITAYNTISQNIFNNQTADTDSSTYFSGLRQNLFSVTASAPGFQVTNSPMQFTPTLGDTQEVHFYLIPVQNAIAGFIKDSTSLAPIANAVVKIYKAGDLDTLDVNSNANGAYGFSGIASGEYDIWVTKSGYETTTLSQSIVTASYNTPVEKNLWLRVIPNAISGVVYSTLTGSGLSEVAVHLTSTGGYDSTIVTESDGAFVFAELSPGAYSLNASKTNYTVQPNFFNIELASGGSASDRNFYFTGLPGNYDVTGTVTHSSLPLPNATVILRSLVYGSSDTIMTDNSGLFAFNNWPTPDQLQVRISQSGYPTIVSEAFDLDIADVNLPMSFPSGQLRFFITADGTAPLNNGQVNVYNSEQNVDIDLISGGDGWVQTNNTLVGNDEIPVPYQVTVSAQILNSLPLLTFTHSLGENQVLTDSVILGITFSGPDTVQTGDAITIQAQVADALALLPSGFTLNLFYKGVGSGSFIQIAMTASPSSGNYINYSAVIPGQSASGIVQYYLQAQSENKIYSNYSNKKDIVVSSENELAIVQLQPSNFTLRLNTPRGINLSTFDDALNPLNNTLNDSSVDWSYWNAYDTSIVLGTITPVYYPTASDSAALRVVFSGPDTGTVMIKTKVTKGDVTISALATVQLVNKVLDSLSIASDVTGNEIANTDSITFTIVAFDTANNPMYIVALWQNNPIDLGTMTEIGFSKARFLPYPGIIGQMFVTVTDSITNISAGYNTLNENIDEQGLFITQTITNTSDLTVVDSAGFALQIPPGSVDPGNSMEISLKRPPLPQVKKNMPGYEIHMNSYDLSTDGQFSSTVIQDSTLTLTLPIPEETKRLRTSLGRWDEAGLRWIDIGGVIASDGNSITAAINGFSEYVVLGQSKPLGIEDLEVHPNPFSPNTTKKLQIEFILNSRYDASPEVTLQIFNMRGDLVRTLLRNEAMPKGPHLYQNGVFQDGVIDGSVEWDGMTEDGLQARNGRYLVRVKVADPSGEKEEFITVVLIK